MNRLAQRSMRWGVGVANVCASAVCGRKLIVVDQHSTWRRRAQHWQQEIDAAMEDPYYAALDRRVIDVLAGCLEPGESSRLLEVGCFFGYRLAKVRTALPHAATVGVDRVFEGLRVARARAAGTLPALVAGDVTRLPFGSDAFDCLYTVVCLTHIPRRQIRAALDELIRVTKRYLVLVEVYDRLMGFSKRLGVWAWTDGYAHAYPTLLSGRGLIQRRLEGLEDTTGHPRFTLFVYEKRSSA